MTDPDIARLRQLIASAPRQTDLGVMRRGAADLGRAFGLAADVTVEPADANGVAAEWTLTPGADDDAAILYLHGGGYVMGSLDSHRHLAAEIGRAAGARSLAVDYRLAPEHPFPAAVDDTLAAYQFLLNKGVAPARIAFVGDSAGGGLAVGTMLAIKALHLPLPSSAWCISPWVDMQALGLSFTDRAAADPMVRREEILLMAGHYLGNTDRRHPLAAPIHADLTSLPPMLIQVGSAETLLDDALALARQAGACDVSVTLQIWPEMLHAWHVFFPVLAAARRAIAFGGAFVRDALRSG